MYVQSHVSQYLLTIAFDRKNIAKAQFNERNYKNLLRRPKTHYAQQKHPI